MIQEAYIIGEARSGTTSLFHWLSKHEEVCHSVPKEPMYFETEYHYDKASIIKKYFPRIQSSHKVLLSARPQSSFLQFVAPRIKETSPDAKIIYLLRDPIQRVYSWWSFFARMRPGREHTDFTIAMQIAIKNYHRGEFFSLEGDYVPYLDKKGGCYKPMYIQSGLYYQNYMRYKVLFGSKNIHIITFDDLVNNSRSAFRGTLNFLDLKSASGSINQNFTKEVIDKTPSENISTEDIMRAYPVTCNELLEIFTPEIVSLSKETGYNFNLLWNIRE